MLEEITKNMAIRYWERSAIGELTVHFFNIVYRKMPLFFTLITDLFY